MKQWEQWLVGAILLSSAPAFAVVNGTDVDWSKQDNVVRLDSIQLDRPGSCTGTLVAGRFVLTAAHCLYTEGDVDSLTTSSGQTVSLSRSAFKYHPNYIDSDGGLSEDVGIIELRQLLPSQQTQYFFDLSLNPFEKGERVTVQGFGGTSQSLKQADFELIESKNNTYRFRLYASQINFSYTTYGDSGSAWINERGQIIATHKGGSDWVSGGVEGKDTIATNLHYAKDFLLETIDGWHYPTVVKTQNGKATVKIQSLHVNGIAPNASVTGDVMLTGGTCETTGVLTAFQTCTYEIETANDNAKGQLVLSEQEMIDVNPASESGGSGESSGGSGSSGGSLGWFGLLALVGLGARRKIWR